MKNKAVAIILAILFGCFTWLYTYNQDKNKFWIGFGITLANIFIGSFLTLITLGLFSFVQFPLFFGLWIWPIVDVIMKYETFYKNA